MYFFVLMLFYTLISILDAKNPVSYLGNSIGGFILYAGLLYFINNPKVKEQFKN